MDNRIRNSIFFLYGPLDHYSKLDLILIEAIDEVFESQSELILLVQLIFFVVASNLFHRFA